MKETREKRRFHLRTSDKILLGAASALMLVSVALSLMQRGGLSPVYGTLMLALPLLAAAVLAAWGVVALRRVLKKPLVRNLVTWGLGIVLAFIMMRVLSYVSYVSALTVPQKYSVIQSPSGAHRLVVMRVVDGEEARIDARRDARRAADPQAEESYIAEDMCCIYSAYPSALGGLFYRSDADVEGEVYLSYLGNDGTMMVEWLEDETVAHFYVDNPGTAEGGELFVRF